MNKFITHIIKGVSKIVKNNKADKYIGKNFNMISVISCDGYRGKNKYYNIECDCGNRKIVQQSNLPKIKSCGCAVGEKYPPFYEIPQELCGIRNKKMRDGKLLVFENGQIFRVKGKLLYRCSYAKSSRSGRYHAITYYEDGFQKAEYVHRLVAEAFVPNPDNKEQVNHIDNDGQNNDVRNLEWVTSSENSVHARNFLGNYSMKNSKLCIFCESVETVSAYLICESCEQKMEKFINRKNKLKKLRDKYSWIDKENLTIRQRNILTLTMNGKTQREIAETYKISSSRVGLILKEISEKNSE